MECENNICEYGIKVEFSCLQSNSVLQMLTSTWFCYAQISKNKRHQDRTAALEIWERLEEFMRSRT